MTILIDNDDLKYARWSVIFEKFDFDVEQIGVFTSFLGLELDQERLDMDSLLKAAASQCNHGLEVVIDDDDCEIRFF